MIISLILSVLLASSVFAEEAKVYTISPYQVTQLTLDPNPPEVGEQIISVMVQDMEGNPITDVEVEIEAFMPEMGTMPFMSTQGMANHMGGGKYEVELDIEMGGSWELPVRVKRAGEERTTEFPFNITIDIEGYIYKGRQGKSPPNLTNTGKTVYISEPRQQLIGVEIGQAEYRDISQEIRTVAQLDVDESKLHEVVLKVSGYIEKLYANKEGDYVQKGAPLFEIYSPELYTAQTEYLQLYQQTSSRHVWSLLKTAKEKLKLWDLTDQQITQLEQQGYASKRHVIYSPTSGYVLQKNLNAGSFVPAGKTLYHIADLSSLWALADIFEYEAFLVKEGDPVSLHLSYLPNTRVNTQVSYIYPTLNSKTRTLKVRMNVPNSELKFKPGMYADVFIQVEQGKHLVVPRRAVMFSGNHKVVFVSLGDGYFEPREVETGIQDGEWFEITNGLKEGDHISFSANFLISSEAKLRNAFPRFSTIQN